VFPLHLPPLRERRGDIPLLVEHALECSGRRATAITCCSPFAVRLLRAYDWPGNVRELFAVIESASIRAGSARIEAQHLPPEVRNASDRRESHPRYRAGTVDEQERESILAALDQTGGVLARSADLLGMGRTTLWRKLKSYGINVGEQSASEQRTSEQRTSES
jgi:DNA-binding NtrC family response regulator